MLATRSEESQKKFECILGKLKDSEFKTILNKDKPHFLPSEIDNYFHRNNLTSNLAESLFSILKRKCKWTKQSVVIIIQHLVNITMRLIDNSINTNDGMCYFENTVNEFTGKVALDYLNCQFLQSSSIESNEKCHCNHNIFKLPCCHWFADNPKTKIEIPPEYLRFKCNELNNSNNEQT